MAKGRLLGIAGQVGAGLVVVALLSIGIWAVRGAMQARRERAEQAWRDAGQCARACLEQPSPARAVELRQCRGSAQSAAELALELPEHSRQQLELQAALDELVRALDSGDPQRLASAVDRSTRAGSALGWRVTQPRLH